MYDKKKRDSMFATAGYIFSEHSVKILPVGDWERGPKADADEGFALKDLQAAVGGYIQTVSISHEAKEGLMQTIGAMCIPPDDSSETAKERQQWIEDLCKNLLLIVNEEGAMMALPSNDHATALAGHNIVGTVLLVDQRRLK